MASRTMFASGESIGRYTVDALLGPGHHYIAYRGHDAFENTCVLKVLLSSRVEDLEAERAAMSAVMGLHHGHLAARTDIVEADDAFVVVGDYVEGPSLRRWLAAYRPTMDEVLALFRGVLHGVDALHHAGVLHGALNPGNVLLRPVDDGLVTKVADFAVVRPPIDMSVYAAQYLAPEVLAGGEATQEADLWSLGCILYELAAGHPPFQAASLDELAERVQNGGIPLAELDDTALPPAARLVVEQCLVRDPMLRISSCDELHERLYGNTLVKRIAASRDPSERTDGTAFASEVGKAVARSLGPGEGAMREPDNKRTASVEAVARRSYRPLPRHEEDAEHPLGVVAGASFVGFGLISLFCAVGMLALATGW